MFISFFKTETRMKMETRIKLELPFWFPYTDSMKNKNNTTEMNNKNNTPAEVIEYLTNYYETFGNLPTPVIECQVSGTAYTAFGSNLKGKIEKAGGIKELLTTFTGKGVVKKADVKKEVTATITPRKKTTKKVIHISANDLEKNRVSLA